MLDSLKIRNDWTREEADALYTQPFNDLLFQAHTVHREHFDPNQVQRSKLISIKTGGCPEDCAYCSQSARNGSQLSASKLIEVERVLSEARKAKVLVRRGIVWARRGRRLKIATWRPLRRW